MVAVVFEDMERRVTDAHDYATANRISSYKKYRGIFYTLVFKMFVVFLHIILLISLAFDCLSFISYSLHLHLYIAMCFF